MEVMVIHEEKIARYSSIEAFNVSVIDENPEKYIFFLTPDEFSKLYEIYMGIGAEVEKAVNERRQVNISSEWKKHGILCGLAVTFTVLGMESTQKLSLYNGYVMGALPPYVLGKDIYAVFLTRRKDAQRRAEEVMNQIQDWQAHFRDKTPKN